MPKNTLSFTMILLLAFISAPALAQGSDTVTVSSFLPSPHAYVQTLRLNAHEEPAGSCDIGRVFMNTSGDIQICQDDGFSFGTYNNLGGWKQLGNSLYPSATAANSSLKVGVGVSTPSVKLHVKSSDNTRTPVVRLENTGGDADLFVTTGSPEGAVTGNKGDLAVDTTNGILYIKKSNGGNTSWSASGASQNVFMSVRTTSEQSASGLINVFQAATVPVNIIPPQGGITLNAAGVFTVPVSGVYEVNVAEFSLPKESIVSVNVNGSPIITKYAVRPIPFCLLLNLVASDKISVLISNRSQYVTTVPPSVFTIRKVSD